jgi:ATP-dependent Zn protease
MAHDESGDRRGSPALKKKTGKSELECTAYHEAGHAVAHLLLGGAVRQVSIVPDAGRARLGHCRRYHLPSFRPDIDNGPKALPRVEREVVAYFAGGIAEAHFRGRHCRSGARRDMEAAFDLACRVCASDEEAEKFLAWLYVRAKGLITAERHWPAVEAVARELLARRTLSGAAARAAFASALGPPR